MICEKMRRYDPVMIVKCPYCKQVNYARNTGLTHYSCPKCRRTFSSFGKIH